MLQTLEWIWRLSRTADLMDGDIDSDSAVDALLFALQVSGATWEASWRLLEPDRNLNPLPGPGLHILHHLLAPMRGCCWGTAAGLCSGMRTMILAHVYASLAQDIYCLPGEGFDRLGGCIAHCCGPHPGVAVTAWQTPMSKLKA